MPIKKPKEKRINIGWENTMDKDNNKLMVDEIVKMDYTVITTLIRH